jgi:hypothetical protein
MQEGVYTAKGWKVAAIVMGVLLVGSWLLIIYAMQVGSEYQQNELACALICSDLNYESYMYIDEAKTCQCYQDLEVVYTQKID